MTTSRNFLRPLGRIASRPLGLLGLIFVAGFVVTGLFADQLSPLNPLSIDIAGKFLPPSSAHWFGTDQLGRDVFSRVVTGARVTLMLVVFSMTLSVSVGVAWGMLAAFGPRWFDALSLLIFDTIRSFPTMMFGLAVIASFGAGPGSIVGIVAITTFPSYGRLARTQTQTLRNSEYILAERAMGASLGRILFRHILPNIMGPILIVASMDVPFVIAIEASLSFLGLGIRPPQPSWGTILNDGFSFIRNSPWIVLGGGLPLVLVTVGFTFVSEAFRDAVSKGSR